MPPFRAPGDDDPVQQRRNEERKPLILPPDDFSITREGGAVRPVATEIGSIIAAGRRLSSATKYLCFWVAEMDAATFAGVQAALKRATLVGEVSRTFVDQQQLPFGLLTDAKFATGFFLCVGSDNFGNFSADILFSAA